MKKIVSLVVCMVLLTLSFSSLAQTVDSGMIELNATTLFQEYDADTLCATADNRAVITLLLYLDTSVTLDGNSKFSKYDITNTSYVGQAKDVVYVVFMSNNDKETLMITYSVKTKDAAYGFMSIPGGSKAMESALRKLCGYKYYKNDLNSIKKAYQVLSEAAK